MSGLVITIDGPAASGKSTVARLLAKKLNAAFLDTGAMYRAATLAALQAKVDLINQQQILDALADAEFKFTASSRGMQVEINGVDVTDEIRDPQITANAHYIAASASARKRLVEMQRRFAAKYDKIVTEGRDQGTVAFPDAKVKFFLTAKLDERTRRRQAELKAKGAEQSEEQVRQAIQKRDASDETRTVGPLKSAADAIVVDTTDLTIEQVVEKLFACVQEKCLKK